MRLLASGALVVWSGCCSRTVAVIKATAKPGLSPAGWAGLGTRLRRSELVAGLNEYEVSEGHWQPKALPCVIK